MGAGGAASHSLAWASLPLLGPPAGALCEDTLCCRESPQERPGSRRSLPGSLSEKSPSMEPSAATPFRVTVTIPAPPSPPGPGAALRPRGPPSWSLTDLGEHPASLALGLPQPPPQGLHQAHQEPAQAGPQPQLPPHPAGVPQRRRRRRRRRRGQ
uniref:DAB2 interacting protein n=1 Tax=Moschus moschiferus TaxID=68415 RepID=A0A8C6CU69_MOSMO